MADYAHRTNGYLRTADGAFIPNDARNSDYQRVQDWIDGGGVPDPAPSLSLAEVKANGKAQVDNLADVAIRAETPVGKGVSLLLSTLYAEARRAVAEGSPTEGEFPLVGACVPEKGADVPAAATAIVAEEDALIVALATIEDARRTAHADIDAAADEAGVASVLTSLSFE